MNLDLLELFLKRMINPTSHEEFAKLFKNYKHDKVQATGAGFHALVQMLERPQSCAPDQIAICALTTGLFLGGMTLDKEGEQVLRNWLSGGGVFVPGPNNDMN